MIWKVLEIEPTKDKKTITRAYRDKLMSVNPEEKPEEFKLLRNAYEEAVKYADIEEMKEEEEYKEKTDIDRWVDDLAAVYFDFASRMREESWERLLAQDVCDRLDSKQMIEGAFLRFVMDNYRIPHKIWTVIESKFHLMERIDSLMEEYPAEFIKYVVLSGITEEDKFAYELLSECSDGKSVDDYIKIYLQARNTSYDESNGVFERLGALPVSHPYGDVLKLRYDMHKGDVTAIEKIEDICNKFSDNAYLQTELVVAYYEMEKYVETIGKATELIENNIEIENVLPLRAHAHSNIGEIKKAIEDAERMLSLNGGNPNVKYELSVCMKKWNEELIKEYEGKLEQNLDEEKRAETLFELAWCYVENGLYEKAYSIIPKLNDEHPSREKVLYLKIIILDCLKESEKVLGLLEIYENVNKVDTNDLERSRRHLVDALIIKAKTLMMLKQKEESLCVVRQLLESFPDEEKIYVVANKIYMKFKMYNEALECAKSLIKKNTFSAYPHTLAAMTYYKMNEDNLAFSEINESLSADGSQLSAYQLKLRILTRNNAIEQAQGLIDYLKENGVNDDAIIKWCEAQLMYKKDGDLEATYAMYQEVDTAIEAIDDVEYKITWCPEFYFMMAGILAEIKDNKEDYQREDIVEILERGLAIDPDDYRCLEYKGWLYKKDNRVDEALEIYHRLEEQPRNNLYIEKCLADLYFEKDKTKADVALKYYKMVEDNEEENFEYHNNVGYLNYAMKNFEEAKKHWLLARDISPDFAWSYFQLTRLYLSYNQIDTAYEYAKTALEVLKRSNGHKRSCYWTQMADVYMRKNQIDEAVRVYKEAKEMSDNYSSYEKDVYTAYRIAGKWEEIETFFDQWEKDKEKVADWSGKKATYYLITGQNKKAKRMLKKYEGVMNKSDYDMVDSIVATCDGDFGKLVNYTKNKLDNALNSDKVNYCYNYYGYAEALWLNSEYDKAVDAAKHGINEYEKSLEQFDVYKPQINAVASVCYAILGDFDKARDLLASLNTNPVCDTCSHCTCYEYYSYSALIEIMLGNFDKAKMLLKEMENYEHGEEYAIVYKSYMKYKELKK